MPELRSYSLVQQFVQQHVDMQFNDVRTMMKLPREPCGLGGGCNFAAATALFNLVSGLSVVLYSSQTKGSGSRFKALLCECYPWEDGENARAKVGVLYKLLRNPFVHNLGMLMGKKGAPKFRIEKGPLTEELLAYLEQSGTRPDGLPLALDRGPKGWQVLSVPGFYWGVFQMMRRLTESDRHMLAAEALLAPLVVHR